MRRAVANKGAVDAKSLQAIIPSNTWRLDLKRLHPEIYHFPRWHMHNPPKTGRGLLGRTPRLTSFTSAWIYSSSHSECSALKFSTQLCLEYVESTCRLTATNNNHFLNPHHQSSTPAPAFFTFNICPRNLVVFVNSPGWICSCPNLGGKVPGLDVLGARCPSFTFSYSTLVAWSDF